MQNSGFALDRSDAASIQLGTTFEGLTQRGVAVKLLALRPKRQVYFSTEFQPHAQAALGFSRSPAFTLPEGAVRRMQGRLSLPYLGVFDSLRCYDACRQNLKGYSLIHERNSLFAFGAALASRRMHIPYVLFVDADPLHELAYLGQPLRGAERFFASWAARQTHRAATFLITVSNNAGKLLQQKWNVSPEKIVVLPNAVDVDCFKPGEDQSAVRRRLKLAPEDEVIMFVGSFWPWHGVEILVDAFASLKEEFSNARLVLVGDGLTRPAVEKKIEQYALGERVILTGQVDFHAMPAMIGIADIVVAPYPSEPEGGQWQSPMKIFEYMGAGKAIVASRVGQIGEVVEDGQTGLLTEPGDVNSLAGALKLLLQQPELRASLGMRARRQAVENHSMQHYIDRLLDIYRAAIARHMTRSQLAA